MINKFSTLLAAIGIGISLFSIVFFDQYLVFGLLSTLAAAVIFALNWQNGSKSILVAVYVASIIGSIYFGGDYIMFSDGYLMLTLILLPLLCCLLGCLPGSGTLRDKIKECLAFVLCIVAIFFSNLAFVIVLSAGV